MGQLETEDTTDGHQQEYDLEHRHQLFTGGHGVDDGEYCADAHPSGGDVLHVGEVVGRQLAEEAQHLGAGVADAVLIGTRG